MAFAQVLNRRMKEKIFPIIQCIRCPLLTKRALARRLRYSLWAPLLQAKPRNVRRPVRQREQPMDFGRISRRHLLQGGAALTLDTALGARSAQAADTTIGFIYVGSRDDNDYHKAHSQ